jgi:ABC-2 type transport system ATP-binding protein
MIEARALTKTFQTRTGPVKAVDGIDLDVAPNEIVGFLGPNGAGKTTTQRMLTTLLSPRSGTALVAGHDLLHEPVEVRRRIGYVAQGGSTEPEALVREELVDQARLYGICERDASARAHTLLGPLDLVGTSERQVKTLSGGQRRRLDIALGLIHSPPLLFLDEPTSGLDPQARANLWEHIERLREGGATIFLTTDLSR